MIRILSFTFFIKSSFSDFVEMDGGETGMNWTWINFGSTGGLNRRILSWIEQWRWVICGGVNSIPRTWPESWIPNRTIPPCPWFKKPQIVWLKVFKKFFMVFSGFDSTLKILENNPYRSHSRDIPRTRHFLNWNQFMVFEFNFCIFLNWQSRTLNEKFLSRNHILDFSSQKFRKKVNWTQLECF